MILEGIIMYSSEELCNGYFEDERLVFWSVIK